MDDVLNVRMTRDVSRLPHEVAALVDPDRPLPPGTEFFEQRFDLHKIMVRLLILIACSAAAAMLVLVALVEFFMIGLHGDGALAWLVPMLAGGVMGLIAVESIAPVLGEWRLLRRQLCGRCTRCGTFLTPRAIVQVDRFTATVVPAERFCGVDGQRVKYLENAVERSFPLPAELWNASLQERNAAIATWASRES